MWYRSIMRKKTTSWFGDTPLVSSVTIHRFGLWLKNQCSSLAFPAPILGLGHQWSRHLDQCHPEPRHHTHVPIQRANLCLGKLRGTQLGQVVTEAGCCKWDLRRGWLASWQCVLQCPWWRLCPNRFRSCSRSWLQRKAVYQWLQVCPTKSKRTTYLLS